MTDLQGLGKLLVVGGLVLAGIGFPVLSLRWLFLNRK